MALRRKLPWLSSTVAAAVLACACTKAEPKLAVSTPDPANTKPSLASLNNEKYAPAPGDLSPEGFNWLHRDLGLIFAGAIYEEGLAGRWREEVLVERRPALRAYLDTLRGLSRAQFEKWPEPQRLSFLINAYHAHVLDLAIALNFKNLKNDLLTKPETVQIFGVKSSLAEFADREIYGKFADARVPFALYCFSAECPELRNGTYNHKNLEAMLSSSANRFFRNEGKNRLDLATKTLTLSPIVYKHKDLIERSKGTLAAFVAEHLGNEDAIGLLKSGRIQLK